MNNEGLLKLVESINMDDMSFYNTNIINSIKANLIDNIRVANNKSTGKANCMKLAKAIFRSSKKINPNMEKFQFAKTIDGVQYVLDGYRIAAFEPPIDLPEYEGENWFGIAGNGFERPNLEDYEELELPEDFKVKYKVTKCKTDKNHPRVTYKFNDGHMVNAEYLLNYIDGFSDVKVYRIKDDYKSGKVLFISGNEGFGWLLPINNKENEFPCGTFQVF